MFKVCVSNYVHSNSVLRPEALVNYADKKDKGLGVIYVKSKATALFIKNVLEEAKVNLYVNDVIQRYSEDGNRSRIPFRPPSYLNL